MRYIFTVGRISLAYKGFWLRIYCIIRLLIIRQRPLSHIQHYIKPTNAVLDFGCGIGCFAHYFSLLNPTCRIAGTDYNSSRIAQAISAGNTLKNRNIEFGSQEMKLKQHSFDIAYLIDCLHHIPKENCASVVAYISDLVKENGVVIAKEINPDYKFRTWFTRVMDKLMSPQDKVYYWPADELQALFKQAGLHLVQTTIVNDILPFPHVVYVFTKSL